MDCIGWLSELDTAPKHIPHTKDERDICDSAYLIFLGKNLTESFDVGDKAGESGQDL